MYTCPNQEQRCPAGQKDIVLSEVGQRTGFSDSWTTMKYPNNAFCKFRISSSHGDSNIILDIKQVKSQAKVTVMVMMKDEFAFPQYKEIVTSEEGAQSFNISGTFFEYLIYVRHGFMERGEFHVDTYIEEAYKP